MATKPIPTPGTIPPPSGVPVATNGEQDARRLGAPPWLRDASGPVLDAYDRLVFAMQVAGSTTDAVAAAQSFISEMKHVEKAPDDPGPLSKGYVEKTITVPGEGTFAVRVNHLDKVELRAHGIIGGTGLHKDDLFAEPPERAIALVQASLASPKNMGDVRRVAAPKPGEQSAPA